MNFTDDESQEFQKSGYPCILQWKALDLFMFMEVGVRIIGIILRILNILLTPMFWMRGRTQRRVPPLREPWLLRSATQLAAAIRTREITSEKLTLLYIGRIQEVNPYLNAVVDERYRAALEDAKEVDRQIAKAREEEKLNELFEGKPLLGVPFTVKESCSLAGLSNSVGCLENVGSRATTDGAVVRLMKQAGGIPLLVSNTPELCLGWESTNLLRGTTNNPYCLSRTPGGSSGGEAALAACGASAVSVSSDIAGSIRVPAAFCGVFGHKPTPGIISIEGHIPTLCDPLFPRLLTVGPIARKAEDLPLLLDIMAGENKHVFKLHEPVDINNIKVHYMTEAGKSLAVIAVEPVIQDMVVAAAQHLHACGATLSETKFKEFEDSVEISVSVFFSMKDMPNMLRDPANPKRDKSIVLELAKSLFGGGTRSLQALGFTLIHRTRLFIRQSRQRHYQAAAQRLREKITNTLGDNGVLLYPVHNGLAHQHNQVFLRTSGVLYTMLFNILGLPATVVPMGMCKGLPVAIQVVAAPNQDRLCLAVAKELERGFGGWRPPTN